MTLSGTRGLVRVSQNPECQLQAAMVVERVKEPEFYRRLTGTDYPGEYGERVSARRRGSKFEENLHRDDAALLRKALAPLYGYNPAAMVVRNLADDVPGSSLGVSAMRLARTRQILRDLADGVDVPHLIIQPQLRLPLGSGDPMYVSPDFVVLNPATGMYEPGEEKSFIVRNNVANRSDLELTRRQAAAEILGLRAEADRQSIGNRVSSRAVFVFATPYGLAPADPAVEELDAEIFEIDRAIQVLDLVRKRLATTRVPVDLPLEALATSIPINYEESCTTSCILASICKERFTGSVRILGDSASEMLGPGVDITRILELAEGGAPSSAEERALAPRLREALAVLDLPIGSRSAV